MGYEDDYKDRLLEIAYTVYLDGMCTCGWPIVVCRDPENDGWFELAERTTVCQVQAVIDREAKDRKANPNYEPEPGELLSVVYTGGEQDTPDD